MDNLFADNRRADNPGRSAPTPLPVDSVVHKIDPGHVLAAIARFMKENAGLIGPALLKHEIAALMRLLVKSGYRHEPY